MANAGRHGRKRHRKLDWQVELKVLGSNPRHDEDVDDLKQGAEAIYQSWLRKCSDEKLASAPIPVELLTKDATGSAHGSGTVPCVEVSFETVGGDSFNLQVPLTILVSELRKRVAQVIASGVSKLKAGAQVHLIDAVGGEALTDEKDLSITVESQGAAVSCRLQVVLIALPSPMEAYREGGTMSRWAKKKGPPPKREGPGDIAVLIEWEQVAPHKRVQRDGAEFKVLQANAEGNAWITEKEGEKEGVPLPWNEESISWRWKPDPPAGSDKLAVAPPYPVEEGDGKQCPRCFSSRSFEKKKVLRSAHRNHQGGTILEWCPECGFLVWWVYSY